MDNERLGIYKLGGETAAADLEIVHVRDLSSDEAKRYLAAIERLHDLERTTDLMAYFLDCVEAFAACIANVEKRALARTRNPTSQDPSERRALQSCALSAILAFRLYLEHWQAKLSRDSDNPHRLVTFKAACKKVYDEVPEYAFLYHLRNFVQHCGMPLQTMHVRQWLETVGETEEVRVEMMIGFNRDELLSSFSKWKHAMLFLVQQPLEFPAMPILVRGQKALGQIEAAVISAFLDDLWDEARFVTQIVAEGCSETTTGTVASLARREIEGYHFHPKSPPLRLLRWLQLISVTEGSPSTQIIWSHLEMSAPPRII